MISSDQEFAVRAFQQHGRFTPNNGRIKLQIEQRTRDLAGLAGHPAEAEGFGYTRQSYRPGHCAAGGLVATTLYLIGTGLTERSERR
jgi:hypothetical protein